MNVTKKLTQREFIDRVKKIGNGEYTVLGEYKTNRSPVLTRHEVCGYEWEMNPGNFYRGRRCPSCNGTGKKITQEDFENRIKEQSREEYIVIGEYIGRKKPVLIKHKKCGQAWMVRPEDFYKGCRCPSCYNMSLRITQKEFENRIEEQGNGEYTVIGKYQGIKEPVLTKHNLCGYEWGLIPDIFFRGHMCPSCSKRPKIDTKKYIEEVKKTDENYRVLGEYKTCKKKVEMIHKTCGNTFEMSRDNFLRGKRCPHCKQSHGETFISNFLKEHSINYEFQKRFKDCRDKYPLPFDFYIPTLNYCIEFDGIQHFEPVDYFGGEKAFKEVRRRDGIKTKYCEEKGIKLLRIRYDEDVEEKINSILKKSKA